jgi:hypothetical protein
VVDIRTRPTSLIILVVIELFGVAMAVTSGVHLAIPVALPAWAVVEGFAIVLAFAAWPVLAVRAALRPSHVRLAGVHLPSS